MANIILSPEVETILRRASITGNILKLPEGQLERSLYEQVNKAIVAAGGRWKRGVGHVFASDPTAKFGLALETGTVVDEKKLYQFFPTPAKIAADLVVQADVNGQNVLEPSAGDGALVRECIAQGANQVTAVEIDPSHWETLIKFDADLHQEDFLTLNPKDFLQFDRVVMNPPFTKQQDLKHVAHAAKFLKPNGRLMAIMQGNRTEDEIKRMVGDRFEIYVEPLPPQSFRESGTDIHVQFVQLESTMPKQTQPFSLTPQTRFEIIQSALHHVEKNGVIEESRRLHRSGTPQCQAIKQALGTGGAGEALWTWSTHPKGLQVNYRKDLIIPWSDLVPYVWPPKPIARKPIRGKVNHASAWSSL